MRLAYRRKVMVKAPDKILAASGTSAPIWPWLKRASTKLPLLVFVGLFLFHFAIIRKYAVNLPNWDDWAMFAGDNHPASVDLRWLYNQHNEHRTTTTKLFVWLQFQLNGWNVRTHLLVDFLIYGFFLGWLVWFARKIDPHLSTQTVLAFLIFFLSPIIWLEHFMAYPVAVHFWLIFLFIAAYFLFSESQTWPSLVIASLSSILSSYSFAAGFVTSLILLLTFWLFKSLRIYQSREKKQRVRELLHLLLVTVLVGGALVFWIIGFQKPIYHPPLAFPYQPAFWRFFLNLVSFAFAIDRISYFWGVICLTIILAPICGEVWKRRGRLSGMHWAAVVSTFAILADLAAISMGRAGFGALSWRNQEYAEHGMPLIILSVINWSIFFRDRKTLRTSAIAALWIFCLITFKQNWDFDIYRQQSAIRLEGARCVKAYYEQLGDAQCPGIYPPSADFIYLLAQGKRLNASYYQDAIKARMTSGPPAYLGALDVADCNHIAGWAYDKSEPDAIVVVDIYDGSALLGSFPAISFRPDLLDAGMGTGLYSFERETPPALKDGRPHSIRVQFAGTTRDLPHSPMVLTCAPP